VAGVVSDPWPERAAIFLKAADLLSGSRRYALNAATMLGQSKTVYQAEIDSAAELIDFWRFNVDFMLRLYDEQPHSVAGLRNSIDYRPLEGFIFTATPFNFTAIAGNLPSAPALLGNTVVWKPSATAKYSAHFVMEILREAAYRLESSTSSMVTAPKLPTCAFRIPTLPAYISPVRRRCSIVSLNGLAPGAIEAIRV